MLFSSSLSSFSLVSFVWRTDTFEGCCKGSLSCLSRSLFSRWYFALIVKSPDWHLLTHFWSRWGRCNRRGRPGGACRAWRAGWACWRRRSCTPLGRTACSGGAWPGVCRGHCSTAVMSSHHTSTTAVFRPACFTKILCRRIPLFEAATSVNSSSQYKHKQLQIFLFIFRHSLSLIKWFARIVQVNIVS